TQILESGQLLGGRKTESLDEEGRHLATRHRPLRAEPVVVRRVAASGDTGFGQGFDLVPIDGVFDVAEASFLPLRKAKRSDEERRHLPPADRVVRTEDRFGVVTPASDA